MMYVISEKSLREAAERVIEKRKKDSRTIVIKCSNQAFDELMKLLKQIEFFGNVGHSATIRTDPKYGEPKGDRSKDFGFDGDGSSKIYSIKEQK